MRLFITILLMLLKSFGIPVILASIFLLLDTHGHTYFQLYVLTFISFHFVEGVVKQYQDSSTWTKKNIIP